MEGGFNKEYRRFAGAAKDAGYSRVERKTMVNNKDRLADGGGKSLQNEIGPNTLLSFFELLQGGRDITSSEIHAIGNFLYKYRKSENISPRRIPEGQRRLINLGCSLIEDSFYRGNLLDLPKEYAAPLSFTVNVLAKVAEEPVNKDFITGFHIERARTFVDEVTTYKNEEIARQSQKSEDLTTADQSTKLSQLAQEAARFEQSVARVIANLDDSGVTAAAYLIKTCLIVGDMTAGYKGQDGIRRKRERSLAKGFFIPGDLHRVEKNLPAYLFYKDKSVKKHTTQHFIPEEVPFAVWATRYLRTERDRGKIPMPNSLDST